MPRFLEVSNVENARSAISATELSVDGTPVTSYDLDTTPLTAADVGAYTQSETDDLIVDAVGSAGKVATTSFGGAATENGANTWTKLASITLDNAYTDVQLLLAVTGFRFGTTGTRYTASAIVNVNVAVPGNFSTTPYADVQLMALTGWSASRGFSSTAFKVVGPAAPSALFDSKTYELWIKKTAAYGQFVVHQIGRIMPTSYVTVEYHTNAGWQSAEPTGAVINVPSSGVTVEQYPVVTTAAIMTGTGSPEGAVAASVGTLYRRTDGGANTTLYVKESGTGGTGWVAK